MSNTTSTFNGLISVSMLVLECNADPSTTACLDGQCISITCTFAGYPIGVGSNKANLNAKMAEAIANRDSMQKAQYCASLLTLLVQCDP